MNTKFNPYAMSAVAIAKEWADRMGQSVVDCDHLLFGLMRALPEDSIESPVERIMRMNFGVVLSKVAEVSTKSNASLERPLRSSIFEPGYTGSARAALRRSRKVARRNGHAYIWRTDVAIALVEVGDPRFLSLLRTLLIDPATFAKVMSGHRETARV